MRVTHVKTFVYLCSVFHERGVAVTYGNIKKPMSLSRLGMILQQQGYQSKRIGKNRIRGWIVYEKSADEVQANRHTEGRPADGRTPFL